MSPTGPKPANLSLSATCPLSRETDTVRYVYNAVRSAYNRVYACLEQFEGRKNVAQIRTFGAAGRRGAADIIENLAVPHAVIGQPIDPPIAIEIDGDDPLIDHLLRHEGNGTLGSL